jgi:hypothetical protein
LNYTYLTADNKWIASVNIFGNTIPSQVGLNTSLAINGFGEPAISYRDAGTGALKFARYFSPIWDVEFVNPGISDGQHSSTAWIDDYRPAIAFYDQILGDLVYARWNLVSQSWLFERVDTMGVVGQYVSLLIDSAGNPHMSYYDVGQGDLKYAYWDSVSASWQIITVDSLGDVGYFSSLALDESNRPYISYYDKTNESIKYAYKDLGNSWQNYGLVKVGVDGDGVIVSEAYTSISLFDDDLGNPNNHWRMRIAYYDDTQKDLMLAVANTGLPTVNGDWAISTVDSVGNVGRYVSMAIRPGTDDRQLCYFDETNGDLKYAKWTGVWSLEIVESTGVVGQYCSIALNSFGEPAISYYDAFFGRLKFARTFNIALPRTYIPILIK